MPVLTAPTPQPPSRSSLDAVAQRLRAFRKSRALTPGQAARQLDVARSTWFRWESGVRRIDETLLPRVAQLTGIAPRELRPDLAMMLESEMQEGEAR